MSIRKVFINFGAPHFTLLCKIFSKVSTKTSSAEEYLERFDRLWCPHFTLCTRYSCKLVLECLLLTNIWKVLIDFGVPTSPLVWDIPVMLGGIINCQDWLLLLTRRLLWLLWRHGGCSPPGSFVGFSFLFAMDFFHLFQKLKLKSSWL